MCYLGVTLSALRPRWLTVVVVTTMAVFLGHAGYLYGPRLLDWVGSDAAIPTLIAADALRTGHIAPTDWYYGNGDVWLLSTHLFAIPPVAFLGIGLTSARIALVLGFASEVAILTWAYRRLAQPSWLALFAAALTLTAWSQVHVHFVYTQLSYGFHATLQAATFASFAACLPGGATRLTRSARIGLLLLFLVTAANAMRGFVFLVAPLVVGCAWPWRDAPWRPRLRLALAAVASGAAGLAVYELFFLRVSTFTPFKSHEAFALSDVAGVARNVRILVRGLLGMCGWPHVLDPTAPLSRALSIPVLMCFGLLAVAVGLVARHAFASRAATPVRFMAVVILAQLVCSAGPVVVGNLVEDPYSVRYVMTSLLMCSGLAAIVAVEALRTTKGRRLSAAWLALVPVTAAMAAVGIEPPAPARNTWPDIREQMKLAAELARRHVTHGFSDNATASLLTLVSRGAAKSCPVYFSRVLIPQRWHVETSCYDAGLFPEELFVVTAAGAKEEVESVREALGAEPVSRFSVGPSYDVLLFRTAEVSLAWLDQPVADGDRLRFPYRMKANHPLVVRGQAILKERCLIATGEPGPIMSGPFFTLPAGRFVVRWVGSGVESTGEISFSVAAMPSRLLGTSSVKAAALTHVVHGDLGRLELTLPEATPNMQVPMFSTGGARVELDEIVIERASP